MEDLIETLRKRKTGYGHFLITVEMDGEKLRATTTNTMAIDAAFDNDYDDDTEGRYYESQREAQESLVNEIFRKNSIESKFNCNI